MLTLTETQSDFERAPEGVHPARCFRLIDLGTQKSEWQGQITQQRKLMLSFELLGEDRMSNGKPFSISRRFTASLGEKSALRAFLQQWRGKAFTPEELKGFDLKKLLGAPCLITTGGVERAGRQYSNILAISPVPRGMTCPPAENPPIWFDLDDFDLSTYDNLGKGIQDTIAASPEHQKFTRGPGMATAYAKQETESGRSAMAESYQDFDDELPAF